MARDGRTTASARYEYGEVPLWAEAGPPLRATGERWRGSIRVNTEVDPYEWEDRAMARAAMWVAPMPQQPPTIVAPEPTQVRAMSR